MLLFTTTPASAITPIPVITTPKGWPMIIRPRNTPMVDMTTADSTRPTEMNLLNCAKRTAKIRNSAAMKAFARNAPASACSSSSPAMVQRTPWAVSPRAANSASTSAVTASRTGCSCTPAAMPA